MDNQNTKRLKWQILGLKILELVTPLMEFTTWTIILGTLGVAVKDEVLTFMVSSELSLSGELVTAEVLNSYMNGIILLIAFMLGCSSWLIFLLNFKRISSVQAKSLAIGFLSLMIMYYTIELPFFVILSSILIWLSLKICYSVFRKFLWMRELGQFWKAKSLNDLPNYESISEMDNQHGFPRDYIAYFSDFLPDHQFVILESVGHIIEDGFTFNEGQNDGSDRKVYFQKIEVVYRFKNSDQHFTKIFTLPEKVVTDPLIRSEGGITS